MALLLTHLVDRVSKESSIMFGRYAFPRIIVACLAVAWVSLRGSMGLAQQTPVSLPVGWQQMSPIDFAAAIRTLFNAGTFNSLTAPDRRAARLTDCSFSSRLIFRARLSATKRWR